MFLLKFRNIFAIALTVGLVVVTGCATQPGKTLQMVYAQEQGAGKWPDQKLEQRFQEYWLNRFAGHEENGYDMENPYFREMVSMPKYETYVRNTSRNKLIKLEIQDIQSVSEYLIKIDYVMLLQTGSAKPIEVSMADRWVFTDGKWYHVIRDPLFSL